MDIRPGHLSNLTLRTSPCIFVPIFIPNLKKPHMRHASAHSSPSWDHVQPRRALPVRGTCDSPEGHLGLFAKLPRHPQAGAVPCWGNHVQPGPQVPQATPKELAEPSWLWVTLGHPSAYLRSCISSSEGSSARAPGGRPSDLVLPQPALQVPSARPRPGWGGPDTGLSSCTCCNAAF